MKVHAIILALNEEDNLPKQLSLLYTFCSGISVLSQYDRDWYGNPVSPDRTVQTCLDFPDPEGKIHVVVRRWRDQAAALNCEMDAFSRPAHHGVISHGSTLEDIQKLHEKPDYFWIVDADEFYDPVAVPRIFKHLFDRRPRGMRVLGFNYVRSWNRRVPVTHTRFCQFGFVRPDVRFVSVRHTSFNESRLSKLLSLLKLPDFSAKMFGFINCPLEVGFFHHGCWLGDEQRMRHKFRMSAHRMSDVEKTVQGIASIPYDYIPTDELPSFLKELRWPPGYLD